MKHLILPTIALLAAAGGHSSFAAEAKRPNVLFILTDDQRWDCPGLCRHIHLRRRRTSTGIGQRRRVFQERVLHHVALLAEPGVDPQRPLRPHPRRAEQFHRVSRRPCPAFPALLQAAGYDTAYIGKWHMGEDNDKPRPGFDYFVTHKGQGKYFDTEFNINGTARDVTKGYYTHVVTDMAIDWLKRDRGDKPWLLMLGHKAPHSFYFPEPKYAHTFDHVHVALSRDGVSCSTTSPPGSRSGSTPGTASTARSSSWRKKFPDDSPEAVKDFETMTRAYWGTILSVDDSVGRLLRSAAKTTGSSTTRIIVFMSDNGLLERRARHGRQAHHARAEHPHPAAGRAIPA